MYARLHRTDEVLDRFCASAVRNARRLAFKGDSGFTLIEMLISMTVLLIVSSPLAMVMTTSIVTHKYNKQRTLAQQAVMQKVEAIRGMSYDSVGTVNGNPSGTITTPDLLATSSDTKLKATLTAQVAYVNDPTPTGFVSQANYKKVTVTVTRNGDSKLLAKEVTYIAPPGDGSFSGSGKGIIGATIVDYVTHSVVPGVTVNLGTGPSAPRTDVSDANGKVGFPQLTINPGSGSQAYYDLTIPASSGWMAFEAPPSGVVHTKITANQLWPTTIQIYKPGTINTTLVDSTMPGAIPSGVQVDLGTGPSAPRSVNTDSAGKASFTPLVPNSSDFYDLSVPASSGWTLLPADASPAAVAHGTVGQAGTWSTSLRVYKTGVINVTLKNGSSTYTSAATITISSPRGSATYAISNGTLTVTSFAGEPLMPNQTYTVGAQVGTTKFAPAVVSVVPASGYPGTSTQAFTLALNSTVYTMRTLNVTVRNGAGVAQSGARVDLTGGTNPPPSGIVLTATTNSSGIATFSVPDNAALNYNLTAYKGTTVGTLNGFAVTGTTAKTVTVS